MVLVLSSCHGIQPSSTCKRWVKGHKHKKTFPQPESISKYNTNMGGVDLMDRMLALYPHWGYRTRKWTVRVILHFIMVATVNIWFERSKESSFFDHALLLADEILAHAKKMELKKGILGHTANSFIRTPGAAHRISNYHLPEHIQELNAKRCRYVDQKKKSCGGKSRWICSQCKIPLCLNEKKNCFKLFHSNE